MEPEPPPQKRQPTMVRILRTLRIEIDKHRADTRQSLSEWIEEAAREKLAAYRHPSDPKPIMGPYYHPGDEA